MNHQSESVRSFFEGIAPSYAARYGAGRPYHAYFFQQRLRAAMHGLDLEQAHILDLGAGTGALYDALRERVSRFSYLGTDISQAMLAHSRIPPEHRFVGQVTDPAFPRQPFDKVFVLGVTTYLGRNELRETFAALHAMLEPGGVMIVSFTHRRSLDHAVRALLEPMLRLFAKTAAPGRVLSQSFAKQAYVPADLTSCYADQFEIGPPVWLNQTLTPFNLLFPRLAVFFADKALHGLPSCLLPYFSADFLIRFTKKNAS